MEFSGIEFLNLAKRLNTDLAQYNHSQSVIRTIINRSYYGAFLHARSFLEYGDDYQEAIHTKVGKELENYSRITGNRFWDLLKYRKKADYKTKVKCVSKDRSESIRLADLIIKELNTDNTT